MRAAVSVTSLRELKQTQQRLRQASLVLVGVGLFLVLLLGLDMLRSVLAARAPMQPILPSLGDLEQPMAQVPSLNLPGSLLAQPKAVQSKKLEGWTDEIPKKIQWRVKGILLGAVKRALLEDPEQKQQLWVTEGQQVGPSKVVRIDERSVTLETEGETREIRM